jgi:hypothetical protein
MWAGASPFSPGADVGAAYARWFSVFVFRGASASTCQPNAFEWSLPRGRAARPNNRHANASSAPVVGRRRGRPHLRRDRGLSAPGPAYLGVVADRLGVLAELAVHERAVVQHLRRVRECPTVSTQQSTGRCVREYAVVGHARGGGTVVFDGHSASAAEKSAIASAYLRCRTAAGDRPGPTAVLEYLGPRAHDAVPDRRAQSRRGRGERVGRGGLSPASVAQRVPAVVQKDGVARLARHRLQSRRFPLGAGPFPLGPFPLGPFPLGPRRQHATAAALASSKSAIAAECRPTLSCTSARELYLRKQSHAPCKRARV